MRSARSSGPASILDAAEAGGELRTAVLEDVPGLERLIDTSVRHLQTDDYDAAQIERALKRVFGVDRRLLADRTYFVIDDGETLMACGGWSWRSTLFGADAMDGRDDAPLTPGVDAARIRAFFVHPGWARRGLASRLLARCEAEAGARGFDRLVLGATLTGEPMYARRGFVAVERLETPLPDGFSLPIVRMEKTLRPASGGAASRDR